MSVSRKRSDERNEAASRVALLADVPQAGAAVETLECFARDEEHENRGDDPRHDDRPEVFEDDPVGVHQPHAVGHEEEGHGPEQEARGGTHPFGGHPPQAEACEEEDHPDDVPRDVTSREQAQGVARKPEKEDVEKSCHIRYV